MNTLNNMTFEQRLELENIINNASWERIEFVNYIHTHNRVQRTPNGISCEMICKNQYGSAYGLETYCFVKNESLPDWLGFEDGPDWIDLEV